MINPTQTVVAAIFQNEVRLNSRRVAPYALMALFGFNAMMWTVWGAAVHYGWATNSDFYISRNFKGFVFGILGLPLFAALIMADPVIRDFRLGVDPLIFSKPVTRRAYLLGKFLGSFFVLVCCMAAFALTMMVLQVFHTSRMVVLPFRVFPYFKHFLLVVVVTYLLFAAIYFTVGTLTRNAKIAYGLAFSYYPLYIALQLLILKNLPLRWRVALDPLLMHERAEQIWGRSADWVDRIAVTYTPLMLANRALVLVAAAACLLILYKRFVIAERPGKVAAFSTLNLTAASEAFHYDPPMAAELAKAESFETVLLPSVTVASLGAGTNFKKLGAALGVELRLLRTERSLLVIMPLATFLSIVDVAFFNVVPDPSYAAAYAASTGRWLLLFLLGLIVFQMGEAMHRDREIRVEPMLWTTPAANHVLLLSKFLATLLVGLSLVLVVGLTAIAIQMVRGRGPIEIAPYLLTQSVILLPGIVFIAGVSLALNVLLRDKYLTYAVSIGASAGLYYVYGQGHTHWSYNPLLYQLWQYADLTTAGSNQSRILLQRIYCIAIAGAALSLAHFFFPRKSAKGFQVAGRLTGSGWSVLVTLLSAVVAGLAALLITSLAR